MVVLRWLCRILGKTRCPLFFFEVECRTLCRVQKLFAPLHYIEVKMNAIQQRVHAGIIKQSWSSLYDCCIEAFYTLLSLFLFLFHFLSLSLLLHSCLCQAWTRWWVSRRWTAPVRWTLWFRGCSRNRTKDWEQMTSLLLQTAGPAEVRTRHDRKVKLLSCGQLLCVVHTLWHLLLISTCSGGAKTLLWLFLLS